MIHRPSTLIGDDMCKSNIMAKLRHYAKELRAVPDLITAKGSFDIIPADLVAQVIAREVLQKVAIISYPLEKFERWQNIRGINFSNIGGMKNMPIKNLDAAMTMDHGVLTRTLSMKEWVGPAIKAGMTSEVAHVFEEFDEHSKAFVHPLITWSRLLMPGPTSEPDETAFE
jgi:hypothetical protein